MTEILTRACWSLTDAREILQTEALAGDDALFLATHTPVRGFAVAGAEADVEDATEEGLLRALSDPARRHAFCVVQGEPGSGKSHLIRWLSVNWPAGSDVPLLVQRANGSLEGALRQLQTRLPDEFQPLFQNLGRRQAAGLSGRASQFLLSLGAALAPDHFTKPPEDVEWCRRHDPENLLLNTQVRQRWQGPLRILKLMDGAGGERNSATASFNLEDILDLARHCGEVHDSVASEQLARRLMREAAFVREALAEGRSIDEVRLEHSGEIRAALALIDALNARRNYAVQHVIGVSADGLKKLFEDLRVELQKRGQRVVLLLEDITSWEGLDDSLIDALVTDARTRPDGDLCPLISVVGVTPEYFTRLPGNYRQRITHDVQLGEARGHLQDVAALREREDRAAFVARYLSAARAGVEELRDWRERFRTERTLSPPNPCLTCARAEGCHRVFGEAEGVGLFPFTAEAIDNLFFALKDDDQGMTHRTPRGLVQAVLSPTLLHPQTIDEGAYPGPQIETNALDRRVLPNVLQSRLNNLVEDVSDRERLRRLLSYWGDHRPELVRTPQGERAYAGLTEGLVAAFGLPWLAGDAPEVQKATPSVAPPPPDPETEAGAPAPAPVEPRAALEAPRAKVRGPLVVRPQPTRPQAPSRTQLERLRNEISALRQGQTPQNSTHWNSALFQILRQVDIRKLGVDRWTWSKIFTPETVKIAGTGQVRAAHFVVERTEWLADGLEAFTALKTGDLTEEESEFSRRRLAFAVRQLEGLSRTHLDRRLPSLDSGERWSPVATAVQILLARAWLAGATSADQPTHAQWAAVLSEESGAESDPAARTAPWQNVLNATDKRHDIFRRALHEMVRLPLGSASGFGITDASEAAAAVVALAETCKVTPPPSARDGEALPNDLEALRDVAARFDGLPTIPLQERKLLASRAEQLFGLLRGQSVPAHLKRLDQAISDVAEPMNTTLPNLVRDWKTALGLERARRLLDDPAAAHALQDAMFAVADGADALPGRSSSLLGWLAAAPAGDLRAALDLALQGERLVSELLPHVKDLVADAGDAADLDDIHRHGRLLRGAAEKARLSLLEAQP